jgi:dTDP-4-dehydrorhamnose reductase
MRRYKKEVLFAELTQRAQIMRVLILGANGMLGHACSQVLSKSNDLKIFKTSRRNLDGHLQFDASKDSVSGLISETRPNWILNCIGIIKPHIKEDKPATILNAIKVNSEFPFILAQSTNASVIQIATDCVYSGSKGRYIETDAHDALDVYGKTKSLGEAPLDNIIHLRASIIGPELGRSTSLLEWFRGQPLNSELNGFTDHLWNGITTHHFAKIAQGIILNDLKGFSLAHIVPADLIRKADLLREFSKAYSREDIKINDVVSSAKIDRTLDTNNRELNLKLWSMAGYQSIPTVAQMVYEQSIFGA